MEHLVRGGVQSVVGGILGVRLEVGYDLSLCFYRKDKGETPGIASTYVNSLFVHDYLCCVDMGFSYLYRST